MVKNKSFRERALQRVRTKAKPKGRRNHPVMVMTRIDCKPLSFVADMAQLMWLRHCKDPNYDTRLKQVLDKYFPEEPLHEVPETAAKPQ